MSRNLKVRIIVGIGMLIVAVVSLYTFNGFPFKILYTLFALMAAIELFSFFTKKVTTLGMILAVIELIFLVGSIIFMTRTDLHDFWYIVLGVCGYDTCAYIFGKLFGGKIFGKSRPFPSISKNKTWEGTIFGIVCSMLAVGVYMAVTKEDDLFFLFCGPLAVIGDLFESYLKRQFHVKDSNEIVFKLKFFRGLEYLVGGSEGHGGFLDRLDSIAFASSVLLLLGYIF
ncbi:phosphatidate cytidylyltransferase [Candidatus Saccharibacteria bacterium]|nr:phosphatidate cytidylyltransferase [Candidatus Saccharibacteria bacterium]